MKNTSRFASTISVLLLVVGLPAMARAQVPASPSAAITPGQTIMGQARFTVISPNCVRMEYAPRHGFVNTPTLFAIDHSARCGEAKVTKDDKCLTIETGELRLEYRPNGSAFSAKNLKVVFKGGEWNPESKNTRNLGGPVPTLDGWAGPKKLPDGLLSRDGWYLIDDSGQPLLRKGWITQRPGGMPPKFKQNNEWESNADLDWYLFVYGTDYKAAMRSFSAISGKAPMPRRHVLGSWYSRWFRYSDDQFRQIVQEYKDHDFPLDILVMDMNWHEEVAARSGFGHGGSLGWTGYTWNKQLIAKPEKLIKDLKDDGVFVTLNDHPCDGMRETEEHYADFMAALPTGTLDNPPFNIGDPIYMTAFFKSAHFPLENQGVDFWWLDWQQDYNYTFVFGVPGLKHLPWLNYLYYKQSERNNRRGQIFSRWGGWGDHRNPIQFSGDTAATWSMLNFQIPFTALSGNAGCFFWAHDLGGFAGDVKPELYARWVQFGALSPALRIHSCFTMDKRPWLWGERFEKSMRSAYHLRSKLMPYIYTAVRECHDQTLPLLRPMYLEYADTADAYQNPQQYLFGDALLVAPITSPGLGDNLVAEQKVWFPKGPWYSFFSGKKFSGNSTATVKAAIDEIPLFAKAGVPIPMQPYTQRMATTPLTTLVVRCYPGDTGVSSLYEDDGQTQGYLKNEFATTALSYQRAGDSITVKISPVKGSYAGQPANRSYRIELPCTNRCSEATSNGQRIGVEYDADGSTNIITIPTTRIDQEINIQIKASEADFASATTPNSEARALDQQRGLVP